MDIENIDKVRARYDKHAYSLDSYLRYDRKPRHQYYLKILSSLKRGSVVLSLGCGGGREVKFLVKNGHKVVAIDFSKRMIESSKAIEPNARYYCTDALDFVRKDKRKYDYIIGMDGFINHLDSVEKREKMMRELVKMLNNNGEIIFTAHFRKEGLRHGIKILVAPIIALFLGELKDYSFGDLYDYKADEYFRSHTYTEKEIRDLFKGFEIKFDKFANNQTEIRIKNYIIQK